MAQVVYRARPSNNSLWASGDQRSRSYKAKDRCRGLAQASFAAPFFMVMCLHKHDEVRQFGTVGAEFIAG